MRSAPLGSPPLACSLACLLVSACASVPKVDPVAFATDQAELDPGVGEHELDAALAALRDDPALHLHLVGHADEDNSDDYNAALSRRRAEHLRERLIAREPSLADRVTIEARGELDVAAAGSDDEAKARNRRVELRFHYPRACEPSFDAAFLTCELDRLPAAAPAPEPTPPLATSEPAPAPAPAPPPSPRRSFTGAYLIGMAGYGITSAEFLRQHVRWGVAGGWSWGWNSDFRIAAGLAFDHLVDVGFLFPSPDSCAPFCERVERSALRLTPELRIGGASQVFWSWIRLNGGVVVQHRERQLEDDAGVVVATAPEQWIAGGVIGIGPGIAFALGQHLFLEFHATASVSFVPRIRGDGTGIFDAGVGLGWRF